METLSPELLVNLRTVMAPFILLTSCATLAWGLQNRFSRVVDAIRHLSKELESPGPGQSDIVRQELRILVRRTHWMRNGLVGYYFAMMCFLGTVTLLLLALSTDTVPPEAIVTAFVLGLTTVCWTLAHVIRDTTRSFEAVERDVTRGT